MESYRTYNSLTFTIKVIATPQVLKSEFLLKKQNVTALGVELSLIHIITTNSDNCIAYAVLVDKITLYSYTSVPNIM